MKKCQISNDKYPMSNASLKRIFFVIQSLIPSQKGFLKFTKRTLVSYLIAKQNITSNKKNWRAGFLKITKHLIISYIIISIVFFGTGLIYLFNPFGTRSVDAAWFNDNWAYRKAVPISSHTAAETTKYISVTISGTDTLVTNGQLQSDCGDIRFTKQNGDLMPYYIASGCNSASTVIHVYFDSFPAGAQTIYFYYGNPSVSNGFSAADFASEAASYVVGTVGSAENAPPPTLYWKFDDAQGTTANDSTPNALNGTLNNTPTWQTEDQCIAGKCLYFSLNGNKSVSRADDPKLDFAAADNFTVSLWIKHPGAIAGTQNILSKATGSPYAGYKIYMDASGDLCFDTRDGTNGADSACTSAVDFDDDAWHFVQGVKAGTTSITLYVDGKQRAQDASIVSTGSLANSGTLYAGIDQDGTSNDWFGFIDEVKIFRDQSARTISQVQADYNARSNPEGVSAALSANTQNMTAALSNGLVGYWKMDENTGTTISDSSGNSNTSSAFTGNTAFTTGKYASGLTFDGTNDVVRIPETTSTDLGTTTDSFTISSWFKTTATQASGGGYVVAKFSAASNLAFVLNVISTNQLQFEVNGGTDYIAATTITVNDGVWHHFVGVRDVKNLKMYLYLDGVLKDSIAITAQNASNNDDISIGNGSSSYLAQDFNGQIDETRIYNRALSPADITQLYTWAPGPAGYWKMDEASGTTTYDSSSNGNNGSLTAGTGGYTKGKYGNAYSFDSANTVDFIGSPSILDNLPASGMTAEAWVYPKGAGENSAGFIMMKNNGVSQNAGWILLQLDSGATNALQFVVDGSTDLVKTTASNVLTRNSWNHVVLAWDGVITTASSVHIYVNGLETTYVTSTNGASRVDDASSSFYIGNDNTSARTFNGYIDETRVYNYQRTSSQIIEDMNAGHPAPGSPVGTPLGYWKFDEGYSTTANNVGNAGNSGTTYTGTLTNMTSPASATSGWTNNGKFGKALLFDGTNDRVDYGDMTALEGLSQASWSMWVKPTTLATNQGILVKAGNAASEQSWSIATDGTTSSAIKVRIASGTTDQSNYGVTPSGTLANGSWAHVMVVFDGTGSSNSDRLKIYVNGKPQTITYTGTIPATLQATGSIMRFSGWSDAGGSYFNGTMDELKIYTEALTESQVKLDMNRSSSEVLGATSDSSTAGSDNTSTRTAQSNASLYCIPGDSSTCTKPVGEWNLDEGSGTSAQDSSGTANTGTITAGSGGYVNGKINKSYNFDGASTVINAGSASSLDDLPAAGFTAEAWIYPKTAGEGTLARVFDKTTALGPTNGWIFTLNGGCTSGIGITADYNTTDFNRYSGSGTTACNTWQHVVLTWDGTTAQTGAHIYINGKEVSSYSGNDASGTRASDAAASLRIGNDSTSARTFDGFIDQAKIFNYVRTPAQVAWDYNQGKPIAHWKMDECQGTTINDMSDFSNTGTLTIGATGTYTTPGTCSVSSASSAWYNGATGKRNYSMAFDGTNDYITMGDVLDFEYTSPFTISAWVKTPTATPTSAEYVSAKLEAVSGVPGYGLSIRGDVAADPYEFELRTTTSALSVRFPRPSDTNWQHIVVGYRFGPEGTWTDQVNGGAVNAYVNGIPATITDNSNGNPGTTTVTAGPFNIASRNNGTGPFVGQIDDIKVYNYKLTATQVKSLYNDGATRYGPATGAP